VVAHAAAPSGPGADVGLLDAPAVNVNLRERAAVLVGAMRNQDDVLPGDQVLQLLLRRLPAKLLELRCVNVAQADFLAVADQRIAIDRDAARQSRRRGSARQQQGDATDSRGDYGSRLRRRYLAMCRIASRCRPSSSQRSARL
jgi:hypothetical protein